MIKVAILFIICSMYTTLSFAQLKDADFINITQQDGLPSNETYCAFKDSKGYIWIATDQGVVRHKGASMQIINDLPDNVIFKIREDKKGRVWFFSSSGRLAYFFNEKIYPFKYNDSILKDIGRIIIIDAYISAKDEIILNSHTGGNYKIDINTGTIDRSSAFKSITEYTERNFDIKINIDGDKFPFAEDKRDRPIDVKNFLITVRDTNNTHEIKYTVPYKRGAYFYFDQFGSAFEKERNLLFWGNKYLVKLKKDGTIDVREFSNIILSMYVDTATEVIWLGFSKGGAMQVNMKTLAIINNSKILETNSISSIQVDNEGGTWFTSLNQGVFFLKNNNVRNQSNNEIPGPVYRILKYNDSTILFVNNKGLYSLINDTITTIKELKGTICWDLFIDKSKNIYLAGLYDFSFAKTKRKYFHNNTFNARSNIDDIKITINNNDKRLYYLPCEGEVATLVDKGVYFISNNFLFLLDSLNSISQINFIKMGGRLFSDSKNQLWLVAHKLYQYQSGTKIFTQFRNTSSMFTKEISCMRQMPNNIYTIGAKFGGVALMQDSTLIGNITEADGLLDNTIKYLLPVGDRLWVATPKGISVIRFSSYIPLRYTITNFGENTGLNNCIIYQLINFKDNILAATSKGIYQISNVEALLKQTPPVIPLYITTVSTYLGDTSGISQITLPFLHNRLSVNFDAICYNVPKEIIYYYRLSNDQDTTWHTLSSTQIVLENLAPGSYDLQIKAALPKEQRFSNVQSLNIIITKPWWQLNVLRVAAFLLLFFCFYFIYRWRINIIKKRESEKTALKTQMAALEQTALRAQMNPHFIFNCLTSIQQLVMTGSKEDANEYLVKFSRLIRKTLELSANPYTSIAQEKDYLTEYLQLEQLRMPGKFDFYFTIDKNIDTYRTDIPNMMLQPIVENCVRHGIKHLQNKKGIINIEMQKVHDSIRCTITDNGVGRNKINSIPSFETHKSYGMNIVKKRLIGLPEYDGSNYFVEITDIFDDLNNPAGTTVIIQLPFKMHNV